MSEVFHKVDEQELFGDGKPKEVQRVHPAAKCEECPLYGRGAAKTQFPTGGAKPLAAIVSRSPGRHDTLAGRPFAGPSGKVLDHLLNQNGVERRQLLVTNVVLCSPPEGKVPPQAIEACSDRLKHELRDVNLVLAAGSEAVTELIGRGTIERLRGYVHKRGTRRLVASNNPALVLRDDSTFPNLVKDFRRVFNPLPQPSLPAVKLIEDRNAARKFIEHFSKHTGNVSCDIESRGGLTHKATLATLQFAFERNTAYVLGERQGLFDDTEFIEEYLRPFFASTDRTFIYHNGIFDTKILNYTYDIPARVDEDTLLLSYALDERGGVHELEYLLMEEFGWPNYVPKSVNEFKKSGKIVSEREEKELAKKCGIAYAARETSSSYKDAYAKLHDKNYIALCKYAGHDAAGTFQLFDLFSEQAHADGLYEKPYKQTLIASHDALAGMETTGMPYNYNRAAELLETEVIPELVRITREVQELVNKPALLLSSPQQLAALFYDDWQLMHDMRNRPDKARSVDESARKEITDGRFTFKDEYLIIKKDNIVRTQRAPDADVRKELIQDVVRRIDRFSKLNKQAGTYLRSLIERAELDPESRIYTSFPRHATSTGRLASRGPNLQNVTRTKEGLPDIRGLFFAPRGQRIVQADYSQAELRTIASLSKDPFLWGVYERDEDLHDLTAARFYGEDFTSENRSNSKNMNFGVFYWQSAATFQEKHEIPEAEAQKYIDWVWATFTTVRQWQKEVTRMVHENRHRNYSYVESPFGHRRRFYLITDENRNASYREAINFLPQNIAANLTLHACIVLHKQVDPKRARLCLTVHDSILAQVDEDYIDDYSKLCTQVMVEQPKDILGWTLPFKADVGVGTTWANAK